MKKAEQVNMNPKATFYAVLYADFKRVAVECGYTLAIHGSMASDMDLIAVPWVEKPEQPETLVAKIAECIGQTVFSLRDKLEPELRPHGRLAYAITILGDWYIDLSIMPILPSKATSFLQREPDLHGAPPGWNDVLVGERKPRIIPPVLPEDRETHGNL